MLTWFHRWSHTIASAIPPLVVCGILAVVAYWGHATEWQAQKFSAQFPNLSGWLGLAKADAKPIAEEKPADAVLEKAPGSPDWCEKHAVSESLCTTCHPDLVSRPGGVAPTAGEVPIQSSHDAKQCQTHREIIRFKSAEAAQLAGIRTATAEMRPLDETATAYGLVEYDEFETAKLGSRAPGTVWETYKRLGDRVRKGELLALIDAAEVGKAKAEFLQAAVQLDTRVRARAPLQADRVAERLIQEADAAVREARARLFTAQQALLTLGLPLQGDEATLPDDQLQNRLRFLGVPADIAKILPANATTSNLLPLVAPFDGTIIERKAVRGESVAAQQPLFTVSNLTSVHVLLDFRPEDASRLALKQRVEFRPDGDSGPPAVGELHWISPGVDEKTRLVHAHAEVPNPTGRLRANAFGMGTVFIRRHAAALVVPVEAVQWEGCNYVVFVREPVERGKEGEEGPPAFRARKVLLGLRSGEEPNPPAPFPKREGGAGDFSPLPASGRGAGGVGFLEILVGLKPGEVVATGGSHVLKSHLFRDRLGAADD